MLRRTIAYPVAQQKFPYPRDPGFRCGWPPAEQYDYWPTREKSVPGLSPKRAGLQIEFPNRLIGTGLAVLLLHFARDSGG